MPIPDLNRLVRQEEMIANNHEEQGTHPIRIFGEETKKCGKLVLVEANQTAMIKHAFKTTRFAHFGQKLQGWVMTLQINQACQQVGCANQSLLLETPNFGKLPEASNPNRKTASVAGVSLCE